MSKYFLVARFYDSYSNRYTKEIIIKELKGVKLSSLVKIDEFTSCHSREKIFSLIEKEYNCSGFNRLEIKYKKYNSDEYSYLNTIVDDNKFYNTILGVKENVTKVILGKVRTTNFIDFDDSLYKEEYKKLLERIKDGSFNEYCFIKNDLVNLVNRCNLSYGLFSLEDDEEIKQNISQLKLEFARYKTFRGWYVFWNNKRFNMNRNTNVSLSSNSFKVKKDRVFTIEENEKLFDERFKKDHGVSYDDYLLDKYNYDNESFLDEDEYRQMYDYENSNVIKKRR